MEKRRTPIKINWREMFKGGASSPDRDVQFQEADVTGLSDADLRRKIAGLRCAHAERRGRQLALLEAEARRREANASTKAGEDCRQAVRSATKDHFTFDVDDELDRDDLVHKFNLKSSPVRSTKRNYGELGTTTCRSLRKFGQMKPISVDKMYSSKPCSTTLSGHQQRVHAMDPKEADHENCLQTQNNIGSIATKRTKVFHHQNSSLFEFQEVQNVVLLDDEDVQHVEPVDRGVPDKWNESKIYYPSRDDSEAVELTCSDIKCLNPAVFLSSPVINYYILYLKRTKLADGDRKDNFYIFNTYFYNKLEEALLGTGEFSKLRRWWKGVDIFQKAYIILPIHGMMHWSLIIVCMPAKESKSGPMILHLDSLGLHSSSEIFDAVGRFLEEEWCYLRQNPPPDIPISQTMWEDLPSNIHKEKVAVPQQQNEYDCGIFMLYYIERFIREAPQRFTRDELDMFGRSWFQSEEASALRRRIRDLLLEEFESSRLEDALSEVDIPGGSDTDEDIIESRVSDSTTFFDSSKGDEEIVEGRQSGGRRSGKTDEEIAEVGASEVATPPSSTRSDKEMTNYVLSEAATVPDSSEDEQEIAKTDSDSLKNEDIVMILSDESKNGEGIINELSEVAALSDNSDSDMEDLSIIEVFDSTTHQ